MMTKSQQILTNKVLGYPITTEPFNKLIDIIMAWTYQDLGKIVVIADIHLLTKVKLRIDLVSMLHKADILAPDGLPLIWLTRWSARKQQDKVQRSALFLNLLERATQENIDVFFLGATSEILEKLQQQLAKDYPNLSVSGMEALPLEPLTDEEDQVLSQRINDSGAGLVFISMESPDQECWMHSHKEKVNAVMIGFGDVFSVFSEVSDHPSVWVEMIGLRWLHQPFHKCFGVMKRYKRTIFLSLKFSVDRLFETL